MKLILQLVCCILIWECVFAFRLSRSSVEYPCSLKPETGPCKGYFERYYYDNDEGKCKTFTYGGCEGNGNNFETLEQCETECLITRIPKTDSEPRPNIGEFKIKTIEPLTDLELKLQPHIVETKIEKIEPLTDLELKLQPHIVETKIEKIEPLTDLELQLQPHIVETKIEKVEPLTDLELKIQPDIVETKIEKIEPLTEFKQHPHLVSYKIEAIRKLEKETERRAEVYTSPDKSETEVRIEPIEVKKEELERDED